MNLRHKQKGAVAILVVVGMIALLAMAGLALDGGHAMLNKTRLQNAVDAAALSGAKELDLTGSDVFLARAAVVAMFGANGTSVGNNEMGEAYTDGTLQLEVQFSATLDPFVPGTIPAEYVRVRARNFRMPVWFSAVVGVTDKVVAATAVAGPSPTINTACNLAPMMVCGDPDAGPPFWGYSEGEPDILKTSSNDSDVGPGNFQLVRLGDSTGGADIRDAMAGGYDGCATSGDVVETEPGNTVGPVAQGINTRFGIYDGSMKGTESLYPPDVITKQPSPQIKPCVANENKVCQSDGDTPIVADTDLSYNYDQYQTELGLHAFQQPPPIGKYLRREMALPIGDCSGTTNGAGEVPLLGFGCFFILQKVNTGSKGSFIFGQFLRDCNAGGLPGPLPGDGPGLYIIQLYKDPDSPDS
jgi:Flp pilus assembly protein TadG